MCVGERDATMVSPMRGTQLGEKFLITSVLNMWTPGPALAPWGTQNLQLASERRNHTLHCNQIGQFTCTQSLRSIVLEQSSRGLVLGWPRGQAVPLAHCGRAAMVTVRVNARNTSYLCLECPNLFLLFFKTQNTSPSFLDALPTSTPSPGGAVSTLHMIGLMCSTQD